MKLFYREYGCGKPLLILHGLFGLSDHWIPIAKTLSPEYRVIIPDLRNHGQSPHTPEMNYELMANDILELLSNLNIFEASVFGHSMGGKLGMTLALRSPTTVDKLVIGDIGVKKVRLLPEIMEIATVMRSATPTDFRSRNAFVSALNLSEAAKGIVIKNLKQEASGVLNWKPNVVSLLNNLEHIAAGIASEDAFTGKVLFLSGEHSDYILPEDIPVIKGYFPNSEFITIEDAGHWIQVDNPEKVLACLKG